MSASPTPALRRGANRRLDLNLLRVVLALHEERHVGRAASRLGMSQPSMSAALARLRDALDDPLFVRTARGMEPTARAEAIVAPAREMLERVEREVLTAPSFDPSNESHPFTFALTDVGEMVFLPRILARIQAIAPEARLRSVTSAPEEMRLGLESGDIDLAIGYFPDLEKRSFFGQRLFEHHFTCLVRADHPGVGDRLSLDQFLGLRHIVVRAGGRSQELFEKVLLAKRIKRDVALDTPHYLSLPMIIARSDLIATVPHAVGLYHAGMSTNIRTVPPPLELPRIVLKQHWHRRAHRDARCVWLRRLVCDLFSQASDEWVTEGQGDPSA